MFICKTCAEEALSENGKKWTFPTSEGPCECCGEISLTIDVPSAWDWAWKKLNTKALAIAPSPDGEWIHICVNKDTHVLNRRRISDVYYNREDGYMVICIGDASHQFIVTDQQFQEFQFILTTGRNPHDVDREEIMCS